MPTLRLTSNVASLEVEGVHDINLSGQLEPLCKAASRYARRPADREAAPSLGFGTIADLSG
jgi:hypothetical protein